MPKTILNELQKCLSTFNETSELNKLEQLQALSQLPIKGLKEINQYHTILLFILGYCESERLQKKALQEMERLCNSLTKLNAWHLQSLTGSGIAFTTTEGAYSLSLIKYFAQNHPSIIAFHSFDKSGIHPKEILKPILNELEFELISDEKLNAQKWIEKASGTKNKNEILLWLVHSFEQLNTDEFTKDYLFESLKLYISFNPQINNKSNFLYNKNFSKSFGNLSFIKPFYHSEGLLKRFDEKEIVHKRMPSAKKLSSNQKKEIIEKSRIALLLLNRETDPITYCNEDGINYYELEHGLSIALFSMLPQRRFPLESYIGFMMFKNGYPMAYGGGWLLGNRSLLGINIFEAYRGGESAFVFSQLLRTYKQCFGANYFEVEPYQFGKNNPEGIQSGAFWFYYRFGFRPVDKELYKLAENEFGKIQNNKTYRSSFDTLRLFTKSNLAVNFGNQETPINPGKISSYITSQIAERFNGNRIKALNWCIIETCKALNIERKNLNSTEIFSLKKLAPFAAFCLKPNLSEKEIQLLKQLVLAKAASEFNYISISKKINFNAILKTEFHS